jgi:hypothetical protein
MSVIRINFVRDPTNFCQRLNETLSEEYKIFIKKVLILRKIST